MNRETEMYNYLKERGIYREQADNWNIVYHADRDRIMFPIHDEDGQIAGATWRVGPWSPMNAPKYINSKNSEEFNKSTLLYGLHKAKQDIVLKDSVIIVEGQFDVILSHINGFENTVGISGTALTMDQINILSQYTDTIILGFDNDEAGQRATDRSYNNIAEYNRFMSMYNIVMYNEEYKRYDKRMEDWNMWTALNLISKEEDMITRLAEEVRKAQDVRLQYAAEFSKTGDSDIICILDYLSDIATRKQNRLNLLNKMDGSDQLVDVQTIKENVLIETLLPDAKFISTGHNQEKCLCPLHNEKTPSFTITTDKNLWHCFGCGEGGSNIDLMMKLHKLTTGEAIKELKKYLN